MARDLGFDPELGPGAGQTSEEFLAAIGAFAQDLTIADEIVAERPASARRHPGGGVVAVRALVIRNLGVSHSSTSYR